MDKHTEDLLARLIQREGGYVNDPNDPGGETKYGISKRSYPEEDIKNLTVERASQIFYKDFYLKNKINLLPVWLQETVLDWTVHSGAGVSIKELQRLLGVRQIDGKVGFETALAAEKVANPPSFILAYVHQRVRFMSRIVRTNPKLARYLPSWVNRALGFAAL